MPITIRLNLDTPSIAIRGSEISVMRRDQISDLLRGESDLVDRIAAQHGGAHPDEWHLSDDEGCSNRGLRDMFSRYQWRPSQIKTQAKSAKILELTTEPTIIATQDNENPLPPMWSKDNDGFPVDELGYPLPDVTVHCNISRDVESTVGKESHWDVGSSITSTVSVEVGGEATGAKVGASTALSFSAGYGESKNQSNAVRVGSESGAEATLKPGQLSRFILTMDNGKFRAQARYTLTLLGGSLITLGRRLGNGALREALSLVQSNQPPLS